MSLESSQNFENKDIEKMTLPELEEELTKVETQITKIIDPSFTPELNGRLLQRRMNILKRIEILSRTK